MKDGINAESMYIIEYDVDYEGTSICEFDKKTGKLLAYGDKKRTVDVFTHSHALKLLRRARRTLHARYGTFTMRKLNRVEEKQDEK